MAAPVTSPATFAAGSPDLIYPSVINGEWVQVVSDCVNYAFLSSVALNPRTYINGNASAFMQPLIVGIGTKLRLSVKYNAAAAAGWSAITGPNVVVVGADNVPSTTGAYPSGTIFWRIDKTTFTAASTTLPVSLGGDQTDGINVYGSATSATGYSLFGAKSVLVLTTVAATNDDFTPMQIMAQIING